MAAFAGGFADSVDEVTFGIFFDPVTFSGRHIPQSKSFRHLTRKKGVVVFANFRKGSSSLWFCVSAGLLLQVEADSAAARLNFGVSFRPTAGRISEQ